MTENIQKGLLSELFIILKLFTNLVIRKLNFQHFLFFTAFLTFGLGDGITAAIMMENHGAGIEANPVAKNIFLAHGPEGLTTAKIWFTLIILFAVQVVQLASSSNMYWTINGFLAALTAGGLMAMDANISATTGNVYMAPGEVIFIYLVLVLIFTEFGSFIDGRASKPQNA